MVELKPLPGSVPVIGKDGVIVAYVPKAVAEKCNFEKAEETDSTTP